MLYEIKAKICSARQAAETKTVSGVCIFMQRDVGDDLGLSVVIYMVAIAFGAVLFVGGPFYLVSPYGTQTQRGNVGSYNRSRKGSSRKCSGISSREAEAASYYHCGNYRDSGCKERKKLWFAR